MMVTDTEVYDADADADADAIPNVPWGGSSTQLAEENSGEWGDKGCSYCTPRVVLKLALINQPCLSFGVRTRSVP